MMFRTQETGGRRGFNRAPQGERSSFAIHCALCALCLTLILMPSSLAAAETEAFIIDAGQYQTVEEVAPLWKGAAAPDVIRVENGELPVETMAALMRSYPEARLDWGFTLYGQWVTSEDTSIDLDKKKVRDYEAFMAYLDCLPGLRKLDMYESRINEAQMETLSQRYPHIRFGWTLVIDTYRIRTDVTAFSTKKGNKEPYYKTKDFLVLKHCKDLVALDLGHNRIDDISFLENFPHMKILILADNRITDISVLEKLPELEYVELFMNQITDVTPLANLERLLDLNLCYNEIADPSPLYKLQNLERLWMSKNGLPQELTEEIAANMPNTHCEFSVRLSTQGGWREHPRYYTMANIFTKRAYRPWDE